MMRLIKLAWLVLLRNWVLLLVLLAFNAGGNLWGLMADTRPPDEITTPLAVNAALYTFDASLGFYSLAIVLFFMHTLYAKGVMRRLLLDGLSRYDLVLWQLVVVGLVTLAAFAINLASTQALVLKQAGSAGWNFITHLNWPHTVVVLVASIVSSTAYLIGLNLRRGFLGVVLVALVIWGLQALGAVLHSKEVLERDYTPHTLKHNLFSENAQLDTGPLSVLILCGVLVMLGHAATLLRRNQ